MRFLPDEVTARSGVMSVSATYERHPKRANKIASFLYALAGDIRKVAQQIENDSINGFVRAVAVIVIAAWIVAVPALIWYMAHIDQKVTDGFCHVNQSIDEIRHPAFASREC